MDAAPLIALAGLVGLVAASELLVRLVRSTAARLQLPPLLVGLTVASVGTSVPEMATNVAVGVNALAGSADASGVAVGNILGSCLAQVTLLLGLAGLARGLTTRIGKTEIAALLLAIFAATAASLDGQVQRAEGVALVLGYLLYLVIVYRSREHVEAAEGAPGPTTSGSADLAMGIGGLVVLALSAQAVVSGSVAMALDFGMSQTTAGVFVGVGTGLPELAVALSAVRQGEDGIAIGNLLGSNITDPLLSFGLGAIVHPVTVPVWDLTTDFLFWAGGTAIALLLLKTHRGLDRNESVVLLVVFALYLAMRWTAP